MIYYVKSGVLYTASHVGGAPKRIKGDDITSAFLNEKNNTFVITKTNGKVEIISDTGLTIRNICNEGLDARFEGDNVLVREKNGSTTLRSQNGLVLRNY